MAQQWECGGIIFNEMPTVLSSNCGKTENAWHSMYKLPQRYIPNSSNPDIGIKTIPINIVVFGEDDSTGFPITPASFTLDSAQFSAWLNQPFTSPEQNTKHYDYSDSTYKNYVAMSPDFLEDSKIRIKINKVYYYNNSQILNTHYVIGGNQNSFQYMYNYHLQSNPEAQFQLNCYLVKQVSKTKYDTGSTNIDTVGVGGALSITLNFPNQGSHLFCLVSSSKYYEKFYGQNWKNIPWAGGFEYFESHLPHELGHFFGLGHPYESETLNINHIDFLSDLFPNPPIYGSYNNFMGGRGSLENDAFSPIQMGRTHRILSVDGPNSNVFRRHFAYGYNPTPIEITSNQTWDFTFKSYNDIVVKPGNTLTITCRLEMVREASIIVEPGARLIIDGGTITSARSGGTEHEGLWQGIKLYGNSSLAQTMQPNGYYPQAHLIMKNRAIIENAYNAVTNWKYNDYNKIGGLIHASNSTFRNNKRSVEFMAYNYTDKSYFNECNFIMDDTLIDGSIPNPMVTMWNIKGPRFTGTRFYCADSIGINPYDRPKGIYTIGAGFTVNAKCTQTPPPVGNCPFQYSIPSSFKGLSIGIHATNSVTNTFKVQKAVFDSCQYGILTSRVNNFAVLQSEFNVNNYFSTGVGIGLANEFGTGFHIQENRFNGASNTDLTIGLWNSETGIATNTVYKNIYNNLQYANWSSGTNWAPSHQIQGLLYECNTHSNNTRDISVVNGTVGQNQGQIVSLGLGGYAYYPAKNTFSNLTDPVGHFANYGNNHVYYVFANDNPSLLYEPTKRTLNNVSVINVSYLSGIQLACPTKLTNIGDIPAPKTPVNSNFSQQKHLFNETAYTYQTYIDGGNTANLLTLIDQTWPSEAWQLRNDLLVKSPYLSLDVLYGLADKTDAIPHALMLDVFMANPHCGRDPRFTNYLLSKTIPMPSYMVDILKGDSTRTIKDEMESAMSYYMKECSQIAYTNMHYYLTDTLNYSLDSASTWSQRIGDLAALIYDTDMNANLTEYTTSINLVTDIQTSNPRLPSELKQSLESREDIWLLLKSFQNQGKEFWELDSSQQVQLSNFALTANQIGNTEAKNILEFFYGYKFDREITFNENLEPKSKKLNTITTHNQIDISIYPIPAIDYIVFDMSKLESHSNSYILQIMDLNGRVIRKERLNEKIKTIDIQTLASGSYIYKIQEQSGREIKTGNFIKN